MKKTVLVSLVAGAFGALVMATLLVVVVVAASNNMEQDTYQVPAQTTTRNSFPAQNTSRDYSYPLPQNNYVQQPDYWQRQQEKQMRCLEAQIADQQAMTGQFAGMFAPKAPAVC